MKRVSLTKGFNEKSRLIIDHKNIEMKRFVFYTRCLFALLVALLAGDKARASHILAMDIYYTWVSGNTYQLNLAVYGDCGPSSHPVFDSLGSAIPRICVLRNGGFIASVDLIIQDSSGTEVTPVCDAQKEHTQCKDVSSSIPGITRFIYSANFTLPAPTTGVWQFLFDGQMGNSLAGRSANITNIATGMGGGSLIQLVAMLDNRNVNHNSTATFAVIPTPFFCLNEDDTYNPGAVDPDGDSLKVIDLVSAIDGPLNPSCQIGTPSTYTGFAWNPPFTPISATTPLNVEAGSFNYNTSTGQLNFRPNALQRSTVVYNVQEFRNGQVIGSCQREMNFLVQSCVGIPPKVKIDSSTTGGIVVDSATFIGCRNSGPFSFYFNPREPLTPTNKITVTWTGLNNFPVMPVVSAPGNGTPTPQVKFSWTATGVPAGVYFFYLTYTDDNCPLRSTATTAITVKILDSMIVKHTVVTPSTCAQNELIRILPSGGGAPWRIDVTGAPPQSFSNVSSSFLTGLEPGTHVITISSSSRENVCRSADTVVVLSADITGPKTVCQGSSIMLSSSIAGGTWSSDNTALATVVPAGPGAGTVTGVSGGIVLISYTFSDGCSKTATITVKPLPAPITGTMHVCTGFTTPLSDTVPGGTWSSQTPGVATVSTSGVVTGVSPGTAIISYAQNGCAVTASVTVEIQPTVTSGSPNICTDGITLVSGLPAGGVWSVSNSSAATIIVSGTGVDTIAGVFAGSTIITYTLGSCSASDTIGVVSFLPPISGPDAVCTGQSIVLSDSIIGGTWSSSNTAVATADRTAGAVIGVAPGNVIITYTIGGSCVITKSVTVNQSPDVGVISGPSDVCVGYMVSLSETVAAGLWAMSNSNASVSIAGIVTGVSPGRDTVFYIVSNPLCKDTATAGITVHAVPDSGNIIGPAVMCVGDIVALSNASPGGVWSSLVTTVATITNTGVVAGILAGVDTIRYTVTNPGCSTADTHIITVYDHPDPGVITGLNRVCAGSPFPLANNVAGGKWTSANTTLAVVSADTGRVTPIGAGIVVISYTVGPNAGGCYAYATYSVTVLPKDAISVNTTVTPTSCYNAGDAGIAVVATGTPSPFEYSWLHGSSDSVLTNLAPGTYVLHVTQPALLCMADDTTVITQPDSLIVTAEVKQDICEQGTGSVTTKVTGGTTPYRYEWQTGYTTSDLQRLHAGTYSVVVTDMHNCVQTLSSEVTRNDCIIEIFDVITPNGDGINDVWIVAGLDNYPQNTVQVFDKWGDLVFERTNYKNDWTGNGKNGQLPAGTYYYVIKLNATNKMGVENTYSGTILLKR